MGNGLLVRSGNGTEMGIIMGHPSLSSALSSSVQLESHLSVHVGLVEVLSLVMVGIVSVGCVVVEGTIRGGIGVVVLLAVVLVFEPQR